MLELYMLLISYKISYNLNNATCRIAESVILGHETLVQCYDRKNGYNKASLVASR